VVGHAESACSVGVLVAVHRSAYGVVTRRAGRTRPRSYDLGDEVAGGVDVAKRRGFEQAAGVDVVLAEQIGDNRAGDL
jgi:hypothetical protein